MSLASYLTSKFKNTIIPIEERTIFHIQVVEDIRLRKGTEAPRLDVGDDGTAIINEEDWVWMEFYGSLYGGTSWKEFRWQPKQKFPVHIPESQFVNLAHEVYFYSKLPERQYKRALCSENCCFLNPWFYWYNSSVTYDYNAAANFLGHYSNLVKVKKYPNRHVFADIVSGAKPLYSLFYPSYLSLNEDFNQIKDRLGTALSPYFCSMYDHEGVLSLFYGFNKVGEISRNYRRTFIKIVNPLFEQEVLDFVKENENDISVF